MRQPLLEVGIAVATEVPIHGRIGQLETRSIGLTCFRLVTATLMQTAHETEKRRGVVDTIVKAPQDLESFVVHLEP